MKIAKNWELHHIAYNYPSDVDFENFMNIYKKDTAKPHSSFLNTTLAWEGLLRFKNNLLERL